MLWENLIHDNGKLQLWSELGLSSWYRVVPSLLIETNDKTNPSHCFLHYTGCQDLCHTCSADGILDFPSLSVWHLSEMLPQLYFLPRVPLHTACTRYHSEVWRRPLTTWPTQLIPKLSPDWNLEMKCILSAWPANPTFYIGSFHMKSLFFWWHWATPEPHHR